MRLWDTANTFLTMLAGALVVVAAGVISFGAWKFQQDHGRLKEISLQLSEPAAAPLVRADLIALKAATAGQPLSASAGDWLAWDRVPPRLAALRPDWIYSDADITMATWKGPLGTKLVLRLSEDQQVILDGHGAR